MRPTGNTTWLRWLTGVLLALLVHGGIAPMAFAACGDHVVWDGQATAASPAKPTPPADKPCHGPQCSTGRSAPLSAPAVTPPTVTDGPACLTAPLDLDRGRTWSHAVPAPAATPVSTGDGLFDPPR